MLREEWEASKRKDESVFPSEREVRGDVRTGM